MEETADSIIEAREELVVSPSGGDPTLRKAHFIKPTSYQTETSSNQKSTEPPFPANFNPKSWPLKVKFNSWRYPPDNWKSWVQKMASLHKPTWEKAGIFEAILNSRYKIIRDDNVVLGFAEKWCDETKSFIFPWGEATITLEDVIVLGGYSVLGSPIFKPLEKEELKKKKEKLVKARKEINRTSAKKATQSQWLKKFMNSGNEIEHEAFIVSWLSRFVFPSNSFAIVNNVFPMAVHLARGDRIALAPAVLAHIYKDLTTLKKNIIDASKFESHGSDNKDKEILEVTIWSSFQLVQVWGWERFIELRPKPKNLIKTGDPWLAQWHNLRCRVGNVRTLLDSAKKSFAWRPYVRSTTTHWNAPKDETLAFARCVRVSQLVGLDCVVQYLPNRVALQFGLDQDIPGNVLGSICYPQTAWDDYDWIGNGKMYIPPRFLEGEVTTRYLSWWDKLIQSRRKVKDNYAGSKSEKLEDSQIICLKRKKRFRSEVGENDSLVPPGFPPKCNSLDAKITDEEDKMSISELLKRKLACSSKKDQNEVIVILLDDDDLDGYVERKSDKNFSSPSHADRSSSSLSRKRGFMNMDKPTVGNEGAIKEPLPKALSDHDLNCLEPKVNFNRKFADLSRKKATKVSEMVIELEDDDFAEDKASCMNFSSSSPSMSASASLDKHVVNVKQPNVIRAEAATGNIRGEEGCSSYGFELPKLEIEYRIEKLERLVAAKLKAATRARQFTDGKKQN